MDETNSFLIDNKIITIDQIKDVTEYLKKTLNYYNEQIQRELQENNNASLYEAHYKHYAYMKPKLEYKVEFTDGRKIDTEDDLVFYDALKEPQYVYKIEERLYISYNDNDMNETTEHNLDVTIDYSEYVIHFITSNKNMNEEHYNLCSYISGLLNNGEDRFNDTIKKRFWIKNLIGLAVGSILTLLVFLILVLIKNEDTSTLNLFFENPLLLTIGGWVMAFVFGSTIVGSIIEALYKDLEDGLEDGSYKEQHEDNYRMFNEVLIGKNYNKLEKRRTIEKLYSISKKVIIIRLAISLIILLILSLI